MVPAGIACGAVGAPWLAGSGPAQRRASPAVVYAGAAMSADEIRGWRRPMRGRPEEDTAMPVSADYLIGLFGLEGDVALITGDGGAIGAATALAYARAGAAVVLADKAEEAAKR